MTTTSAIAKNSIIHIFGKVIGVFLGLIAVAVMTRSLGASGYGEFTAALSFLQLFGILADFGLTLTLLRLIQDPNENESSVVSNIFTMRLLVAGIFFGVAPAIALALPYSTDVKLAIAIGSISFLTLTLSQLLVGVFQKNLKTGMVAVSEIISRGVFLLLTLIAAFTGSSVIAFMIALAIGNLLQFIITFFASRTFTAVRIAYDARLWKKIFIETWPIGVSIAANLVYLKSDIVILSFTHNATEVGLYGAAYKVLDVITIVPMVFMGLVLPLLASSWQTSQKALFNLRIKKAFDALTIFALPLIFGTIPLARDIMIFVAGKEFSSAGPYLTILMIAGAAVAWGTLFGHAIVAIGLQKKIIAAYIANAIISLVLYIIFIPKFGAIAAAWITVISELLIAIATTTVVLFVTRAFPSLVVFMKTLLASTLLFGVLSVMPGHILVRVFVGAICYVGFIVILGAVRPSTLREFLPSQKS